MKLNDEIRKNNPFRVPDDYFESLADRTMEAIRKEEAGKENGNETGSHFTVKDSVQAGKTAVRTGRTIRLKPFLALAAAIVGFAILATVVLQLVSSERKSGVYEAGSSLYADLAFEEVDTYILERELIQTEPEVTEVREDEISSDAIIDYLMTEDIDLNDIYELL